MGWLFSGFNSLFVIVIAAALSFGGGWYMGSKYEKNYFEALMAREKDQYRKALAESQLKYDNAAAEYFQRLRQEQAKNAHYERQVKNLYTTGADNCRVTYGFIRLYNASATGESTNPQDTDNILAPVDLATVLSTDIENHGKYREAAAQIEALKAGNTK